MDWLVAGWLEVAVGVDVMKWIRRHLRSSGHEQSRSLVLHPHYFKIVFAVVVFKNVVISLPHSPAPFADIRSLRGWVIETVWNDQIVQGPSSNLISFHKHSRTHVLKPSSFASDPSGKKSIRQVVLVWWGFDKHISVVTFSSI